MKNMSLTNMLFLFSDVVGTPSDDSSSSDEEVCATVSAKVAKTAGAAPSSPAATPAPPVGGAPPGGPVEIAFSFDTTGSMYACLGEVRRTLKETITRLQKDIPGIRIAVIAHGDYCDQGSSYVTKQVCR